MKFKIKYSYDLNWAGQEFRADAYGKFFNVATRWGTSYAEVRSQMLHRLEEIKEEYARRNARRNARKQAKLDNPPPQPEAVEI